MECNSYKGLFIEYVREMFGKTTISYPPWHAHLRKRINQGVRDVSFSESFANVLNELVLILKPSV